MRPYLALIKDSFRAAVASNVLYVLLGVITLLLLVLGPLHVRETLDWRLRFRDNVSKIDQLTEKLVERGPDADKHPAIARIWSRLDGSLQIKLEEMVEEKAEAGDKPIDPAAANSNFMKHRRVEGDLEEALNEVLKDRDFYDEAAWGKKRLNAEAKDLIDEGVETLSDQRSRRLNRLLMASALAGNVKRGGGNALDVWYGPWQWEGWSFAISYEEFANITLQSVTYIFDKFVLSIGLFIAILVTANFIPETFLPGSLNLLMSKPISRWGLLLAKFVGGCAFVSLCAVYLFVGLWLWLGIQMGIWDRGILWAIPLYIVVFAIYYSVSTFVGVYSRSAILAIIVTAIFWAACFAIGVTYQMFDGRINNSRTRGLVVAKDKVLQIGELSTVSAWNKNKNEWEKALEIKMMEEQRVAMNAVMFMPGAGDDGDLNMVGPIYDPKHDVVLSGVINLGNPSSMNHQDLFVAKTDKLKFDEVGKMPRDAITAVADADGVLVFTRDGRIWRYKGDPEASADDEKVDEEKEGSALGKLAGSLFSQNKKKKKANEYFEDVSPDERISFSSRGSVTLNPDNRSIYIQKNGELTKFDLVNGKYVKDKTKELESLDDAIIASTGKFVVAALTTGRIQLFDAESLEVRENYKPQAKSPYQAIDASKGGRYFSFLCRDRTLWILDVERLDSMKLADAIAKANVSGQGTITASSFDGENRLWYATRYNRAKLVDLSTSKNIESLNPPTSWFSKAFEYGVHPIYWVWPKPGEFYKLVSYLSATPDEDDNNGNEDPEDAKALADAEVDLRNVASDSKDPWQPLWSGLLFMCGMLFLTGLIFQFRDF